MSFKLVELMVFGSELSSVNGSVLTWSCQNRAGFVLFALSSNRL